MKLIQKTTQYYLAYTLVIFGLGALLFYFLIKIVLLDSIDDGLRQEKDQIINNLDYEKGIEELEPSPYVSIKRLERLHDVNDRYTTIQIFDTTRNEFMDFRQLTGVFAFHHNYYQITISHSLDETEALLQGLFPMVIFLFLVLLLGFFVMNNFISRKLWEPFYRLIPKLRNYDLNKSKVVQYYHSDIQEFNELSLSVERMTTRIYKDFLAQKEFNENSSHELQTPLAVIRNKLDLLIQSKNLKSEDLEIVESIYEAVKKLGILNKGLILLNKIENRQYPVKDQINARAVLSKACSDLAFRIEEMDLKLEEKYEGDCTIKGNSILFEILINNLLTNAIKHNVSNGFLRIFCNNKALIIENSGKPLQEDAELMFGRFKKNSDNPQSIGLGLAIVRKICDSMNYNIVYVNKEVTHSISIRFS